MSVGLKGTHDIELADKATSPSITQGLMLAEDEAGRKRVREFRRSPLPPRQSQGPLSWSHQDASHTFEWSQDDWSDGALEPYYRQGDRRYARANSVDARWKGVQALGMARNAGRLAFILRNPDAEGGVTTGWTAGTGVTLTSPAAAAKSGSYGFKMVTDGSRTSTDNLMSQNLVNPTAYQSRQITVVVYLKKTAGTAQNIRLAITDDVTGTTVGTVVSATSFTFATVTHTVNAAATVVTIALQISGSESGGIGNVFFADDFAVIPTGGLVCAGVAELNGNLYGAFGRCVCQWNETNDVWDVVYFGTAATTDISTYNANVVVGYGYSVNHIYGATTSWSNGTDGIGYFAPARNVLWGSTGANTVAKTSDVTGVWGTNYTVGSSDHAITKLYNAFDTVFVGKTDGLWAWINGRYFGTGVLGVAADVFANLTQEYAVDPDAENFARGTEFQGQLFLATSQQGFYRFDGELLTDMSSFLNAPRLADFGGRIRALAPDTQQLWLLVDTPTTDTTDAKTTRLMSLLPGETKLRLHSLENVSVGDINALKISVGYLYALGRSYHTDAADYEAAIYRWTLPTKTIAPYADASPTIATTGWIETQIWHGDFPGSDKAFLDMHFWVKNLDAEHTILVQYGLDGAAATTTTLGTLSGSGQTQTLEFSSVTTPTTNCIGKSIQFRFTLTTDDTVSPELYAFSLHSRLKPERVRMWEVFVRVGTIMMLNGQPDPNGAKATVLSNLSSLETQVYPIQLTADFDNDGSTTTYTVDIVDLERVIEDDEPVSTELYRLVLQEAH